MILPLALLIPVAASICLYLSFKTLDGGRSYWITAAVVALTIGAARIILVALGVYFLERTSGWLQLPGYAMALAGLPEWVLLGRRTGSAIPILPVLAALLLAGSAIWVFAVAGLAALAKSRARHRS